MISSFFNCPNQWLYACLIFSILYISIFHIINRDLTLIILTSLFLNIINDIFSENFVLIICSRKISNDYKLSVDHINLMNISWFWVPNMCTNRHFGSTEICLSLVNNIISPKCTKNIENKIILYLENLKNYCFLQIFAEESIIWKKKNGSNYRTQLWFYRKQYFLEVFR